MAKNQNKGKPRNYALETGVYRFGKSSTYHKKAIYKFTKKTNAKKAAAKSPVFVEKKIGGAKNGGTRMVRVKKLANDYPTQDAPAPGTSVNFFSKHKRTVRSSLSAGTVAILLAGVHKGKRVVVLKQLETGLLLVTGPFKLNGTPLRRVNQRFLLATATKIDVSGVKIPDTINDKYFARVKAEKSAKKDGDIFDAKKEGYKPSEQRKTDQTAIDTQVLAAIKSHKEGQALRQYLKATFALSKDTENRHCLRAIMLVLFETPAGYAVFKLLDEGKLAKSDSLYEDFDSLDKAKNIVKLKKFQKFEDTTEALAAATALVEGKMSKSLKKLLKKVVAEDAHEKLAVADAKLGTVIKEKLEMACVHDSKVSELMRCIRSQAAGLISGLPDKEMTAMELGLAHSLSRYKLKFSPDKIDTMIVQAVNLLDDLDKELNNYIMRCREWYGWHFPELGKIITDNLAFVRTVEVMGTRDHAKTTDLSDVLPEEVEEKVKEAAEISMGTEISDEDILNIKHLCQQVVEIQEYRQQLYEYLKNRMMAIAPNLTILVGELVGARLISHAGSLMNLAKHPASTVQILGAEKALFKALKTKHDTPKYGLIYHAQLVGQASSKLKGKVSRMLAAKAAIATRVDALGEETNTDLGIEHRAKVESRIRQLEGGAVAKISGSAKKSAQFDKYENKAEVVEYKAAADVTIKRKSQGDSEEEEEEKPKAKKIKVEDVEVKSEKKKKKKDKSADVTAEEVMDTSEIKTEEKKKKKKKDKEAPAEEEANTTMETTADASLLEESGEKKKKKKKKKDAE